MTKIRLSPTTFRWSSIMSSLLVLTEVSLDEEENMKSMDRSISISRIIHTILSPAKWSRKYQNFFFVSFVINFLRLL